MLERLRGLCARAYGSQSQAANPFINLEAVIRHSKSPNETVRRAAVNNLVGRMISGKMPAETVLDLLTHPVRKVSAAAFDTVLAARIIVPDLYSEAFLSSLRKFPQDQWTAKLSNAGFPQELLVQTRNTDYGPIFSACSMEALAQRVMAKTIEPPSLRKLDSADVHNLLRYPGFQAEQRVYVLEGLIVVGRTVLQGWEECGPGMIQPGDIQTRYTLANQPLAAALLKQAFSVTPDPAKQLLLDKLQGSEKLGKFVIYDSVAEGWGSWKFSPEIIKVGPDPQCFALGPQGPRILSSDCY